MFIGFDNLYDFEFVVVNMISFTINCLICDLILLNFMMFLGFGSLSVLSLWLLI